jgi:cytoskeleton protein RodZ
MPSLGQTLRGARIARGWSLDEVNRSTRINLKFLEAMESDSRDAFPAAFFFRSFVLQYARALGLDQGKINAMLDALLASEAPPALPGQNPHPPLLARDLARIQNSRPHLSSKLAASLLPLGLALAASSAIYTWWNRPHHAARTAQYRPASVPKPLAPVQKPLESAATHPSSPAQDPPPAAAKAPVTLDLSATEPTWLSVSSDGKTAFRGMLQPNQTKELLAEQTAHLVVGNAGGLIVEWNGRSLGPIGRRGQVRVVSFTPDGYRFEDSSASPISSGATE